MTKLKVTSTYRREFSPNRAANRSFIIDSFGVNYDYREHRRRIEHGHQLSPFVWDPWEYDAELSSSLIETSNSHPEGIKIQDKPTHPVSVPKHMSPLQRMANEPYQITQVDKEAGVETHRKSPSSSSDGSDNDCNCGHNRQNTGRTQMERSSRIFSDTISKKLKNVSKKVMDSKRPNSAPVADSPFVQYGLGDYEEEVGKKRTHNVLPPQGVYESALKAKMRRSAEIEVNKKRNLQIPRPHKSTLFDPRFDDSMNRQTTRWITEYANNYKKYSQRVYSKNSSHKPPF